MTDSPDSAGQPDEPVGVIIARWRKKKKLTGQALGDRVGMSQTKISRLETGAVAAEPADVRLLATEIGMPPAEVERVVELAGRADNKLTEWRPVGPDLEFFQREIGRVEAEAKELRVFQPTVIPGLLQTSEYARAIMSETKDQLADAQLVDSAVAVSDVVGARLLRSRILSLPDHQFHFLITEQVLRNRVCVPAETVAQIARVREVAGLPNVDLRIIPDDAELPIPTYHGFVVADDRWVSVDLFTTMLKSSGRNTVRAYRGVFDALERVALTDIGDLLDKYQAHYARMLLPDSVAS